MPVLMMLKVKDGTLEQYDITTKKVFNGTLNPTDLPKGLLSHVCIQTDSGLEIYDVWDSKEDFNLFGEKLVPALNQADMPVASPEFFEVHNFLKA
ncbi:MAG: hypothetical protein ABSB12_03835 [Candidatus Saccharimonadales bacterium]|jgi:hypothetical protein